VLKKIQHIGLAVTDLDASIALYEQVFGVAIEHRERSESEGIEAATFHVGDVQIELMEPTREDSPVGRFIARRGEGVHHIAYQVYDVGAALSRIQAAGLETLDTVARPGLAGTMVGFIHPKSVSGVLTELVEHG